MVEREIILSRQIDRRAAVGPEVPMAEVNGAAVSTTIIVPENVSAPAVSPFLPLTAMR
jgi:hypothetical protein